MACGSSYDELHHLVDNDRCVRTLLGIESTEFQTEENRITFSYQNLLDNVGILNDETLTLINEIIVDFGNKEVFKKKGAAGSILKTDSFVVKSNVHFPTDYNLLWDASRKSLDMIKKLGIIDKDALRGWRKMKDWGNKLKNRCRQIGQNSKNGGKNKAERQKELVEKYLKTGTELVYKIIDFLPTISQDIKSQLIKSELENYASLSIQFIDQLERRVIKGETIAHNTKLFSIFEQYTQWISKGKTNPSMELGKALAITTNQNGLIIHHKILENESDSQALSAIVAAVLKQEPSVESWSFDKGFYSKENKALLSPKITNLVMPKKGKLNALEKAEEHTPKFIKIRHRHSAIESNINELEHRGLDRCPDRGLPHFQRYIAMGICAFNLHKIGAKIRADDIAQLQKKTKNTKKTA